MNRTISFNIDIIEKLIFRPKSPSVWYWRDEITEKRFFGFITRYQKDGGWVYCDSYFTTPVTTKQLLTDTTLIYEPNNTDHQWFDKPFVEVCLPHYTTRRYFDSNEEALNWMEDITNESTGNFKVITQK